ncbi:MAG: tRNA (N(6)-L-threonylcarbamoyladenosine(37)-C(2))-methylthiotransferase [Candidatus Hadarchaeales archaeon]
MRIYCETYGCTANRGDSEIMMGLLRSSDHELAESLETADLVLLNTCAVKGATYRKMLRRIAYLVRARGFRVVVAGCLPLIDFSSVKALGVQGAVSCRSLDLVSRVVERVGRGENGVYLVTARDLEKPCMPKLREGKISAVVSIAEGCVSKCAYCSVRLARGRIRSFSPESIVGEVKSAVRSGYREILLTAQDTAAYGADTGTTLPSLLRRITEIDGNFIVRVGMMNPRNTSRIVSDLIDVYESEKIYKFIHLPVQSGDDDLLELMKRGYRAEDYVRTVEKFREKFPDIYLATDIIVGFPGEGDGEFRNTLEIIERTKPDKVNISRFSPMPGTEAAILPAPNWKDVAERSRRLTSLCHRIGLEINRRYIGTEQMGLATAPGRKGGVTIRLHNYKPAIAKDATLGTWSRFRITGATATYLSAEKL